jgi:hypothetical protein
MNNVLDRIRRVSGALAVATVAIAVCAFGLSRGSRAAGGADPFGYVSQAYLWLAGDLVIEQPLSREFPWPHPEETLSPLGYRPGETRHTIVPSYAPGVPLIMAAFHKIFGYCGPYIVTPIFAALLTVATFTLAKGLTHSDRIALTTTALIAGSPAFLFNLMFPMSDIVAASLWTAALALLTWSGLAAAAAAAALSGLAILVRPNLVPLAMVLVVAAAVWPRAAPRRNAAARATVLSAGVITGALIVASVNRRLYGSPLASGYGDASILYSLAYFGTNLRRYFGWLTQSETWLIVLAVLPIALKRVRQTIAVRSAPLVLVLFVAIVFASYMFYLPFEDWWFLRFLLPALPIVFLFEAIAIDWIVGARRLRYHRMALIFILGAVVAYRGWFVTAHGLMRIGTDEQRYVAVAQYIERALPTNAVVLSMQHSGSIRYYSGRLTFRYDLLSPSRLTSVLEWFRGRGFRPYILLDESERADFTRHFAGDSAVARLDIRVLAEMTSPVRVRLYDPEPYLGPHPPPDAIVLRSSRTCVPPAGVWTR